SGPPPAAMVFTRLLQEKSPLLALACAVDNDLAGVIYAGSRCRNPTRVRRNQSVQIVHLPGDIDKRVVDQKSGVVRNGRLPDYGALTVYRKSLCIGIQRAQIGHFARTVTERM